MGSSEPAARHTPHDIAPPWQVSQWFNSPQPVTLASLRGRVVVLHAFQMLCPACIAHGLPQALQVFLQEYRVPFPVGIDQAAPSGPVPLTMQAYGLRGTPSLVVLDPQGRVRLCQLGAVDDLWLGALIGGLLANPRAEVSG